MNVTAEVLLVKDGVTVTDNPTHEVSIDSTACDSLLWYGNTYTSTGTYSETLPTTSGCDSIVTL